MIRKSRFSVLICTISILLGGCSGGNSDSVQAPNISEPPTADTPPPATTTIDAKVASSGNWSDPKTWNNSALPAENARILIPSGLTLTVDGEIKEKLKKIEIEGTLNFATQINTQLKVETITSNMQGRLEIGSESNPISADVSARIIFADYGAIDRTKDPKQLSRGAILMGPTRMWGAKKTAWAVLSQQPKSGDSSLILKDSPIGWKPNDRLVLAATDPDDPKSDEVATIANVNGNVITLTSPLVKDHQALKADLDVHVANLTRNIELLSENSAILRRGHVMFMHNLNVDVNYARFYQLGRTDKTIPIDDFTWPDLDDGPAIQLEGNNMRGRYSIHFHRGGVGVDSIPARVRGNVVEDNPGWAYVNHSGHVDFIENVSYNVVGGAFQTEAGDEKGSFIRNIALRTINPNDPLNCNCPESVVDNREDRQDFSFQGDGFWLHSGGTKVEGNVVAGASGHAYIYWPEGLIENVNGESKMMLIDSARFPNNHLLAPNQKIDVWYLPVLSFKNNIGYNATKGLEFFYLHAHHFFTGNQDKVTEAYLATLQSSFEDLIFWNIKQHSIGFNFTERVSFKNVRLVGNGNDSQVGIDADHLYNLVNYQFENVSIEDFGVGMEVPTQGNVVIKGGTYANKVDFRIENPQRGPRNLTFKDIQFSDTQAFNNQERINFQMAPDFTLLGVTQDGFPRGALPKESLFFLMPDRITLDFGTFDNQGLFYNQQVPEFIPMLAENATYTTTSGEQHHIASQYVGLMNQQLKDQFQLQFGGAYLPNDAKPVTGIVGGQVGTAADAPTVFPPFDNE
ncbi:G8 domain-containing protein [Aliikangiella coralliicola]|uniref:G8 domain-containing protein n=1 Tax=Aliikangiella coralliicola TaxID=2592383 RepID=A0A545U8W4_9GAMM|nr:G8 domain-containing protein [Aliikangiella coralliicola]TQV85898.1 hypothetical protein FLL46_18420 [Aliikangiella coralliicola]